MTGYTSMVRREPIGVVGQIAPWNYPLMMAIWKIGPALATGNTIVLKPSELTPLTALRLGELAAEVLPPGVLNVITGDGEPVGAGLVRHRDVRLVSLTGSVERGTGSPRPSGRAMPGARSTRRGCSSSAASGSNDHIPFASEMPHGGFKKSGYGKDMSVYSLEDYTQIKHVMAKLS